MALLSTIVGVDCSCRFTEWRRQNEEGGCWRIREVNKIKMCDCRCDVSIENGGGQTVGTR